MDKKTRSELMEARDAFLRGGCDKPLLLPCPFCGGEGVLREEEEFLDSRDYVYVECETQECQARSMTLGITLSNARGIVINCWNRRTEPSEPGA